MGKKQHAKGRLDKFYHLAKDQGYRARSAFKLIQLNKKYNFLEKSKCLIDLCAAPGGWLQVAKKYMSPDSLIIGVDLDKIKPIPGVTTHVDDITSASCRTNLKRDLKTWKADVVLHDGAPNVGVTWIQDAFTQNELVLASCKLATEFLMPGGTFVTKVFRSKDYNKLLWVFNQLFGRVEATKPTASRSVSAEIFVVCSDYLAPKKIDPRMLDPKHAFKEVDDTAMDLDAEPDLKKIKNKQGAILNELFHPEKRRRFREGYEDGDYTLYNVASVVDFMTSPDYLGILSRSNALLFQTEIPGQSSKTMKKEFVLSDESVITRDELLSKIESSAATTEEIKNQLSDLKLLGRIDFKALIKWRDSLRTVLLLSRLKPEPEAEPVEENLEDVDMDKHIEKLREERQRAVRKEKKKQRERRLKVVKRLHLGMETPFDIGLEGDNFGMQLPEFDDGLGDDGDIDGTNSKLRASNLDYGSDSSDEQYQDSADEYLSDSDTEMIRKVGRLDSEIDAMFKLYNQKRIEKNPSLKIKQKKTNEAGAAFEEWYGIDNDEKLGKNVPIAKAGSDFDSSSSEDEDAPRENGKTLLEVPMNKRVGPETQLSLKAKQFYEQPLFKFGGVLSDDEEDVVREPREVGNFDEEMLLDEKNGSQEDASVKPVAKKPKKLWGKKALKQEQENKGFEEVPAQDPVAFPAGEESEEDGLDIDSAQAYTLAQKMIRTGSKRDLIDDSFNRYAFNDPDLPDWFVKDETRYFKPQIQETKEANDIMREKFRAMDARPIKKVAEAKFRKQLRAQRRMIKAAAKSQGLVEAQEELSDRTKLGMAASVMSKAKASVKKEKDKVKVVVARGSHKAIKGRPKGVKGRYKMVDGPMKKEGRALKRVAKKQKKKRR